MSRDLTADFSALLTDRIRLPARIEELRNAYWNAVPFPHLVIDELFSQHILDSLLEEMAGMAERQWLLVENESRERMRRMRSGVELGSAGAQLVGLVHSAAFLYLLSEITGIWQLLPDPYLQGAGYAVMQPGDFFSVHSDRNIAYETGLTRRLAMIVFLNKSWDPKYKGQLELWNSDATRCDVSIDPSYNRTVIFEVAHPNYHGVPAPIACPADRSRQSFIVYYHTVGIEGKSATPHSSIFAPHFYGANRTPLRSLAREVTPPVVLKAARKLVALWKTASTRSR
jgi:hypothetical protein